MHRVSDSTEDMSITPQDSGEQRALFVPTFAVKIALKVVINIVCTFVGTALLEAAAGVITRL